VGERVRKEEREKGRKEKKRRQKSKRLTHRGGENRFRSKHSLIINQHSLIMSIDFIFSFPLPVFSLHLSCSPSIINTFSLPLSPFTPFFYAPLPPNPPTLSHSTAPICHYVLFFSTVFHNFFFMHKIYLYFISMRPHGCHIHAQFILSLWCTFIYFVF